MALSWSSVLKTNARVRRPGRSAAVTASAASRRRSRSGSWRQRQALLERGGLVAAGQRHLERGGLLGEQALEGRAAGHVRLGEHALLGLGELVGPVAAQVAQVVGAEPELRARRAARPPARPARGSTRGRRRGAGSRSPRRARAPSGCARRARDRPCRARSSASRRSRRARRGRGSRRAPRIASASSCRVELGDAAPVGAGERLGAIARLGRASPPRPRARALDQRLEVPVGGFQLLVGGCAHPVEISQRRA